MIGQITVIVLFSTLKNHEQLVELCMALIKIYWFKFKTFTDLKVL
jgi:hypothetical protein